MKKINLNGEWDIKSNCGTYNIKGEVPGSLFYSLETSGFWKDESVFWRDNNRECREIANRDFTYSRSFKVDSKFLQSAEKFLLNTEGLDTLTEIRLNKSVVGKTQNMHRRYEFDISKLLSAGENTIEIDFFNTLSYIEKKQKERFIWSITDTTVQGFNRIRKCSSSFGWDWGPIIPDLGIWRDIYITAINPAKLTDPEIRQDHIVKNKNRTVNILIKDPCDGPNLEELDIRVTLKHPTGKLDKIIIKPGKEGIFVVSDPELWWPNGYGNQTLYTVTTELLYNGDVIDCRVQNIGLRTMELNRDKDANGQNLGFKVNDITIFAMGGNIIPQDVYITRRNRSTTKELLENCVKANFNCIRIWGGGIYPNRDFYETCDELGLIIWQDLMFACALYEAGDIDFRNEITLEIVDNLKRLRNHPSIGLICGNNEMEWAFTDWDNMEWNGENKAEYTLQYDYLLPEIAAQVCPDIPYWKASPSSSGFFDNPNDPNRGDVHYWDIWHSGAPFTDFRKHKFRFLSEYGFQSFPSYKTVCSYTDESDRNPYSLIMEDHQRNGNYSGNQQIMKYASEYFLLGKDMDSHCYISQLSQAEAGRDAVEHLRQNRDCCLGSTYWQVNDIWPVASWSSIDYFGRWKALHYAMKKAYTPVLLSCREEGTKADIYVSTEGHNGFKGYLVWELKDFNGKVYAQAELDVNVSPREAKIICSNDFKDYLKDKNINSRYISITLKNSDGSINSRVTTTFVRYKKINLPDPELSYALEEDQNNWKLVITSKLYSKFIELDFNISDAIFSDNYFDMDAGEKRDIYIKKSDITRETFDDLKIRSLFNSY